jgi:hypothetical protein
LRSPFISSSFEVISICPDLEKVREELTRNDASKVTLRFSIPSSDYWKVRNYLEEDLNGNNGFHLFKKDRYYLARKVKERN